MRGSGDGFCNTSQDEAARPNIYPHKGRYSTGFRNKCSCLIEVNLCSICPSWIDVGGTLAGKVCFILSFDAKAAFEDSSGL